MVEVKRGKETANALVLEMLGDVFPWDDDFMDFEEALADAAYCKKPRLILDFTAIGSAEVHDVGHPFIGILLSSRDLARKCGTELVLVVTDDGSVMGTMDGLVTITDLGSDFRIYRTLDEALG